MKIMVVSSPHAFSTRDVYTGHLAGLRAALGPDNVVSYDIVPRYNIFTHFTALLEKETGYIPREFAANVLAAEPVFGAAHWHDCDVVYFISPMYFPMSIVQLLRKAGKKCWAYFTECPYEDEFWSRAQAPMFDQVFVNDMYSLSRFRAFNPNTHYIPHGYNPDVHFPGNEAVEGQPVVYVGTGFPKRREMLEQVNWSGIDLRLYGLWEELPENSNIEQFVRAKLTENEKTADIYRSAALGISMHRIERHWEGEEYIDPGEAFSLGPRSYELAACGLFQVSDFRPELAEVFGDSVPVFASSEELEAEVRRYIDDPVRREELMRRQLAAVRPHTVENRMRRLLEAVA